MKKVPLLDTHVWIWWLIGDNRLSSEHREALNAYPAESRPYLCDISVWELAMLVHGKRLVLKIPFADFLNVATSPSTVQVLPISSKIVLEMNALPDLFHKDPADRLITATARAMDIPLATEDSLILNSGVVTKW